MSAYYEDYYSNMTVKSWEIERILDVEWWKAFLDKNWRISIWSSLLYIVAVYGGKWIMADKPKFGLNYLLAMWSGLLAIFSIMGTVRVWPELFFTYQIEGFYGTVCNANWMVHPINQFWTILFVISKVVELGDTAFIILRKQPLIFLHWYHHITVLLYTWYSFTERTSSGRWFVAMNYTVHSIMYTYYALRALRIPVPNGVRMFITCSQLSQMAVGCVVSLYAYSSKRAHISCGITDSNINYCFMMYASYFALFAKFFYNAYINPPPRKPVLSKDNIYLNGYNNNGLSVSGKKMN